MQAIHLKTLHGLHSPHSDISTQKFNGFVMDITRWEVARLPWNAVLSRSACRVLVADGTVPPSWISGGAGTLRRIETL